MVRRTRRIQQLAGALLAVLALMVASVSACTCSHHEPAAEVKPSCHEVQHNDSKSQNESPSVAENCFCVTRTNDVSTKSESFKLKKLSIHPAQAIRPERVTYQPVLTQANFLAEEVRGGRVVYPSVLSRGPPLL